MTIAHKSPIVNFIVFNLIRESHYEKFRKSKKYSIDVSLIPKFNEEFILRKGFKGSEIHKSEAHLLIPRKKIFQKIKNNELIEDRERLNEEKTTSSFLKDFKESIMEHKIDGTPIQKIKKEVVGQTPTTKPRIQTIPINLLVNPPNYGKMNNLIRDKSISVINCEGPEKPLKIIRQEKEQITNVLLTKQEIMNLLYQISAKTRIPLVEEGVYRVSWDYFIINAIVSEKIEPTFVIKRIEPSNYFPEEKNLNNKLPLRALNNNPQKSINKQFLIQKKNTF